MSRRNVVVAAAANSSPGTISADIVDRQRAGRSSRLSLLCATRLTPARKQAGFTQQALAERANTHVTQLRRYEA